MRSSLPWRESLRTKLVGARGDLRLVAFRVDGRRYEALVPDDSLWVAVKDVLLLSEYDWGNVDLSRVSGVVIDGGAHVGLFSLVMSSNASRVVAFEPHAANAQLLQANLIRNHVENVEVRQEALWASDREVTVVEGSHSAAATVRPMGAGPVVGAISLDRVLQHTGPVDLLKLDIEGAEFEVLHAASDETLERVSAIVAEFGLKDRPGEPQLITDRLRRLGFDVQILPQPFFNWKESMARLLRNRYRVEGATRLKLMIGATYSLAAGASLIKDVRPSIQGRVAAFLYACRDARCR